MRAFLYHVLNDLIVDEYRRHKATSLDVLLEKGFEPSASRPERLLDVLDGKAVVSLICQLPEKYQKVMRMRYSQDLSLEEISLITGQSRNTVAVQAHRGLEKLKVLYSAT
jgi:RNA polymerase sigma-70 factor (ECF subfamily)